jgi:hypothetical protein
MSSALPVRAIPVPSPRQTIGTPRGRALSVRACRILAASVIAGVVVFHLFYLTWRCPIDLAEDETYYWDWSRHLDLSYYSKGPATACLIRASCAVFGDTMPGVRYPAVFLRAGIAIMTYWLALRLFGSEALALVATLLSYITPMFLAAGLIMTTDPAYLFCWATATCCACAAIWNSRRWAWIGVGLAVGVGTLTKFSMPLWLVGLLAFLIFSPAHRHLLRTRWPWLSILIAAVCAMPVFIWNAHHNWVTFLHVGEDVGARAGEFHWSNLLDFWIGQLGVIGPLFIVVFAAIIWALFSADEEGRDSRRFLLCLGLPIFMAVFISSFRANPAANWAAAAYVTFFILTGDFLRQNWNRWRMLFYPCATAGLAMILIAHYTQILYPLVNRLKSNGSLRISIQKLDPTAKIKGWAEAGQILSDRREAIGPASMIIAPDYQVAAELAFYMRGRPDTFCAGSYFTGTNREPYSQFDIWLDRRLDHPLLRGRDAIYVGPMNDDLRKAFGRIEPLAPCDILRRGILVRRLECWACYDFRGMAWPGWGGRYNK